MSSVLKEELELNKESERIWPIYRTAVCSGYLAHRVWRRMGGREMGLETRNSTMELDGGRVARVVVGESREKRTVKTKCIGCKVHLTACPRDSK